MVFYQFDEMLEQSRKYPLVFAVSVHPFVIGQPFRLRAFRDAVRDAVRYIVRHRDRLWIATPARSRAIAEPAERHNAGIAVAHGSRGPIPVRNLPNTAKVWEAVQGDRRHGARASLPHDPFYGKPVKDMIKCSLRSSRETSAGQSMPLFSEPACALKYFCYRSIT